MRQIVEAVYENGLLKPLRKLQIPEGRQVTVTLETEDGAVENEGKSYDFSDLVGTLSWSGNAVDAQRQIRDEW
jgi:predicted DNA-binding antitoxin AbrB/MazE fold protein